MPRIATMVTSVALAGAIGTAMVLPRVDMTMVHSAPSSVEERALGDRQVVVLSDDLGAGRVLRFRIVTPEASAPAGSDPRESE